MDLGAAIESLPLMPQIIAGRPSTFASTNEAIDWQCVEPRLRLTLLHSAHPSCGSISTQTYRTPLSAQLSVPSILQPLPSPSTRVTWQTDLLASQPFWESWYTGLSGKFVAVRSARMLVLAGTDRIDKELMIAQMQGPSPSLSFSLLLSQTYLGADQRGRRGRQVPARGPAALRPSHPAGRARAAGRAPVRLLAQKRGREPQEHPQGWSGMIHAGIRRPARQGSLLAHGTDAKMDLLI